MPIHGKLNIERELMTIGTYVKEPGHHWSDGVARGEWSHEPFDYGTWVDIETGYTCAIKRNSSGSWCGYVFAGAEHPIHGSGNLEHGEPVWLDVHGGVTWHGEMQVPDVNVSGMAVGFDCAHHGDMSPRDSVAGRMYGEYRRASYVIGEVRSLAKQVADFRPVQQLVG
jgi:hypothetical protein